jgi:hypothetical protein
MQKGSKRATVAGSKVFETNLAFGIAIDREVFLAGISAERGNGAFTNGKAEIVEDAGTAVGGEDAAISSSKRERSASHGVGQRRRVWNGEAGRISDCSHFVKHLHKKSHLVRRDSCLDYEHFT